MALYNTLIIAVVLLATSITNVQAESCNICGVTNGIPNAIREDKKDFILDYAGLTCQEREDEAKMIDATHSQCRPFYQQCRWQSNCCNLPCRICCGNYIPDDKEDNLVFLDPENPKTCLDVEAEANQPSNSEYCILFQTPFYQDRCCDMIFPPMPPPPPRHPECNICDSDQMEPSITKTGAIYKIFGEYYNCEQLYDKGMNGGIHSDTCTQLKTSYNTAESCCVPKIGEVVVCEEQTCTDNVKKCCDGWRCDWRTRDANGVMKCTQSEANYKKSLLKRSCRGRGGARCKSGGNVRHRYLRGGLKKNSPDVIHVV